MFWSISTRYFDRWEEYAQIASNNGVEINEQIRPPIINTRLALDLKDLLVAHIFQLALVDTAEHLLTDIHASI